MYMTVCLEVQYCGFPYFIILKDPREVKSLHEKKEKTENGFPFPQQKNTRHPDGAERRVFIYRIMVPDARS